ncbi:ARPP-1 family domain-containing protein [Phormidium sp. CCY1219]|uniref:ARPP-1 family domain-containing protein n=1 Tax=Phormidium sp. CCY1219 TaxID=2886104 RepID=UPI002D1E524E|nr:DUF6569 family protein [Phormidium sp. CCY1219]MEB3828238.1 hypothetical protein [Phormidium sp. CCY1219]
MECKQLVPQAFDLAPYQFGMPQKSGFLTVVPIFGNDRNGQFTSPLSGLKLSRVTGYGSVELANPGDTGLAIVPLHIGYIQDKAQNHALCRSAFIAAGQKLMFQDACCVQESQGGYLEERDQWFFILPVQLRSQALSLRGQNDFTKLWEGISELNRQYGLSDRGHLEQIIARKRAFLTQYQSRLECLPGQTGALFFLQDKLAGVEIAPNAAYFREMWMPLVCFCYGAGAMYFEHNAPESSETKAIPFAAKTLQELRDRLHESRLQVQENLLDSLAKTPPETFKITEEERFLEFQLKTAEGNNFSGQFVEEKGELVYASLFAKPEYLAA